MITLLFGPPRSGTTFLQKKLCQFSNGIGIYEPTGTSAFQQIDQGINPYDDIFNHRHPHIQSNPGSAIIVKEVLDGVMGSYLASQGHDLVSWVNLSRLENAKIIWIFRDPLEVWRSIVAQGWDKTYHPLEVFIAFYTNSWSCFERMQALAPGKTKVVSYERLVANGPKSIETIAKFAGLPQLADWENLEIDQDTYYQKVFYHPTVKALMEGHDAHSSLHRGVAAAKPKPAIPPEVNSHINGHLDPLYAKVIGEDLLGQDR